MRTCHLQTFRSLAAPKKPLEVALKELWELAAAHFHPQPSLAVQRFWFNSHTRQAGESVTAYLAKLKKLSEHCNFGDSLNDMLRDRIVCGIQDQRTQRRLLAETDLTLKRAFEVAQAIESADKQVQELQHPRKAEVHAVGPQFRQGRDQVLFGARDESTPETPIHRDTTFARPARAAPTANRLLRSQPPVAHPFASQRSAASCPFAAEDAVPTMQPNALGVPVPLSQFVVPCLWQTRPHQVDMPLYATTAEQDFSQDTATKQGTYPARWH